jgi:dolichyl-phosphate-mannose-protein mannosyltransferase
LPWGPLDSLWLTVLTLVGGVIRLLRVADPHVFVFDEVYYAKDACTYVKGALDACGLDAVQNEVHPPLGKWLIAGGIKAFGMDSLGYRIGAVLAGTLTIVLLYLLARKILKSTLGAAVSAGLLVIDPLHFVQSRTSMLDVFVPLFAVAGFLFLVYDRERLFKGLQSNSLTGPRALLFGRPWRLAAGVAAGGAVATKWSGAVVVLGLFVMAAAWEFGARRLDGEPRALLRSVRQESLSLLLCFVLVPAIVYVSSYAGVDDITGWNDQSEGDKTRPQNLEGAVLTAPWTNNSWWEAFWAEQQFNLDFHKNELNDATHPYQSPPWSWMLMKRPVAYFYEEPDSEGNLREIIATGSPFVWWTSILALLFITYRWARGPRFGGPEGVILGGFFFTYGPWLLPLERPAVFIFYFVVTVPFICLALGYIASRLGTSWEARAAVVVFSVFAISLFIFFYPLLSKSPLTREAWERRLLFFNKTEQCEKPEGTPSTETVTETVNGKVTTSPSTGNSNEDLPPKGWCWI